MPELPIRKPAVSGQFYSNSSEKLKENIQELIGNISNPVEAIGCILPHAGYLYSGSVAGKTVSRLKLKENAIILGPNHRGYGAAFSIMTKGQWQTPLGKTEINSDLAEAILNKSRHLSSDTLAHLSEHSLEVQVPFLQYLKKDIKIVPIAVTQAETSVYKEVGRSIAEALKEAGLANSSLIIASSDMTHYEPQKIAEEKDKEAIRAILELDEDKLIETVKRLKISMCGYAPVAIMLRAAKLLGAKKAELISYQTSADVTGDFQEVVGYAGMIIR
ncbi:MAG: AmmeMemoRadiSam system protein B [Candidatus Omnitrophica bacterium]|nr:AmmeMemoRadiSam system protein B [Candidatus Omnitrophota bacterium]MBU1871914.1 AmmeMemoRadiSam system protein B [Candidatus Omnitrophota bacterium]